jgi:hypothetical protein
MRDSGTENTGAIFVGRNELRRVVVESAQAINYGGLIEEHSALPASSAAQYIAPYAPRFCK